MPTPTRTPRSRPALSRLELQVMNVVWQLGDCSSAEVIAAFNDRRPLAPTTIRTVLANLRRKGYVKPIPTIERGFRFRATVQRETVARRSLHELLGTLFSNSPKQAISCLIEEADMSDADLEALRQMIDQRRQKGGDP